MRMHRIATGILLALLSAAGDGQTKGATSPEDIGAPDGLSARLSPDRNLPGAKSAFLPELFASSHASNLLQLKNGDLLCVWFSGTAEGQSDVAIVASLLPKGSMTWGKPVRVDHDPAKSYQNPVAYQAPNGEIWILHTAQTAGKGQADAQVMKSVSKDGAKTWSVPIVLFAEAGAFTRQPFVRGEHDELILPIYYSTSAGITKGAETNYPVVKLSADGGQTWKECAVPKAEGMVQMSIVKQAPGRYVAFYRSRFADFVHRSTSADGCNWTPPEPTPLPNNNASIQAAGLRDGNIVMVFNNASGHKPGHVTQSGERVPLSIALSTDGGITWKYVRDMETRDNHAPLPKGQRMEYSYPAVLQLANGKIMASYTYRRLGIKTVLIDEAWIKQGTSTGEYRP